MKSKLKPYSKSYALLQGIAIETDSKAVLNPLRKNEVYRSRENIRLVVNHIFLFTRMLKVPSSGRLPEFIGTSKKI